MLTAFFIRAKIGRATRRDRDAVARAFDSSPDASLFDIVEDCGHLIIVNMLERCNWNQTEAADRFHIPLFRLNQRIKRLNIEIKRQGRA